MVTKIVNINKDKDGISIFGPTLGAQVAAAGSLIDPSGLSLNVSYTASYKKFGITGYFTGRISLPLGKTGTAPDMTYCNTNNYASSSAVRNIFTSSTPAKVILGIPYP